MLRLTDAELRALFGANETDRVERKERFAGDATNTIREAVCAFANDLPNHRAPGLVVVSMTDSGQPSGVAVTDELLRNLAAIRDDGNILPLPTMVVEKRTIDGHEYAIVVVAPADAPPVRYRGRVYVRIGPRRGIASAQDERLLGEKRRHRDLPFDLQPFPTASLSDLQRRTFEEEYLPAAFARDVLDANERSYEERLASLRMIASAADPTPTLLGLVVLSARTRDFVPGAYIQFLRIAGKALDEPIKDEEAVTGTLAQVLTRIDEKLRAHVGVAVDIASGATESRSPDYPMAAFEQLVRNAMMHRTYERTNAPVRITWFDDRVEIQSPGGPFGLVTVQNFGQPGVADYRNPNIAEAMKTLGFVQRFGVGIATAGRALRENGNPPIEWSIDENFVLAIVRSRR